MRTPNTSCLICAKPLYRRASDQARARYAACMAHRSEAQKVAGITDAQHRALATARKKGFNYRNGRKDTPETREKRAITLKRVHAEDPSIAIMRGVKTRGELNVNWNGGSSRLNTSIRQMFENRRWADAVKERDGCCVRCGSMDRLESHHQIPMSELIERLGVKNRDDARRHAAIIFDINNGETLCEPCHYAEHGRKLAA